MNLAKLNIFIDAIDYDHYRIIDGTISKSLLQFFGDRCPAFSITVHPPEKPWKIVVEAGYLESAGYDFEMRMFNSIPYVVRSNSQLKEILVYGLGTGLYPDDTYSAGNAVFEQMREILQIEGMSFDNLVRQWNFIGGILTINNDIQNYQAFNELRNDKYSKYRKTRGYPAATGIGMKMDGVKIDFYAVKTETPDAVIPIENPDQVNPYAYEQKVLKGNVLKGKTGKQPPQFERAVLSGNNLFISGTASIIGQDTIGPGDVEKQTAVTLENILKLYHSNKIQGKNGNSSENNMRLIILRVYIRYQEDFGRVKAVCEKYFPGAPAVYIEADICRDDLLVEIEAEYVKSK
jgi:enamine deaminase RidA (YjgF/YER057c/UK114 family)